LKSEILYTFVSNIFEIITEILKKPGGKMTLNYMTLDYITYLISVGLQSLQEYLALHVLMCLVPAFFLAGAIASLFSKESC